MIYSAMRTSCLPKFLPLSRPMNACGRVLKPVGDVLAILDPALLDPLRHVAHEIGEACGEIGDDEAADGEALGQDVAQQQLRRFGPGRQFGRVVLRDQPAHRNARERIEQRQHRIEHRAADILEIDVDAFRARGLQAAPASRARGDRCSRRSRVRP